MASFREPHTMSHKIIREIYIAITTDNLSEAESGINKLISKEPSHPGHYIQKGNIYLKQGRNQDALDAYHEAAMLFNEHGSLKKALAIYQIILRIEPGNSIATHNAEEAIRELESVGDVKVLYEMPDKGSAPVSHDSAAGRKETRRTEPATPRMAETGVDLKEVASNPFFQPFTAEELRKIFSKSKTRTYSDGESVIREGDYGDSLYVIKEGTATVISPVLAYDVELATLTRGDIFGEFSFLTGRRRAATVVAKGTLVVYELHKVLINQLVQIRPEIMELLDDIYHKRTVDKLKKNLKRIWKREE